MSVPPSSVVRICPGTQGVGPGAEHFPVVGGQKVLLDKGRIEEFGGIIEYVAHAGCLSPRAGEFRTDQFGDPHGVHQADQAGPEPVGPERDQPARNHSCHAADVPAIDSCTYQSSKRVYSAKRRT